MINQPQINYMAYPGIWENRLTPQKLINNFCEKVNVPYHLLQGKSRKREIVAPRQILMRLIKLNFGLNLHEIGRMMNKNHATVIHSINVIENLCDTDQEFKLRYNAIADHLTKINNLKSSLKR